MSFWQLLTLLFTDRDEDKAVVVVPPLTSSLRPPLVGPLDDVASNVLGPEAKRYGRSQRYPAQYDQQRIGSQLHRDPELREGGKHRVDYDGHPRRGGQDVAAGGAPDDPGQEVRQKGRQDQDQDGRYDARDVGLYIRLE